MSCPGQSEQSPKLLPDFFRIDHCWIAARIFEAQAELGRAKEVGLLGASHGLEVILVWECAQTYPSDFSTCLSMSPTIPSLRRRYGRELALAAIL
jgi:hypothetical protein